MNKLNIQKWLSSILAGNGDGYGKNHESFPYLKYPSLRDTVLKTPDDWLNGKALDDGAEGLWRVHDRLYDLTNLIPVHPGGTDWIVLSKGTDITEAFESHHVSNAAALLLPKYFVRDAKTPRNSPFTFHEDGFYKTLKVKIEKKLKEVSPNVARKSALITDGLFTILLAVAPLTCWFNSWLLIVPTLVISSLVLAYLMTCAHNYFHQKDNWRMYLFNLSLLSYRDWRVSHVFSHHLYPNTLLDLEISMLEPFFLHMPRPNKPLYAKFAFIYSPIIYGATIIEQALRRIFQALFTNTPRNGLYAKSDLVGLLLPTWMCMSSGAQLGHCLLMWLSILVGASFIFTLIGLSAGHHHQDNFHDGDEPREKRPDWGLHQLDAVIDRVDITGSLFRVLTHFGDHALHHLFPSLDHAVLPYLYPVFLDHCEKYHSQLRVTTQFEAFLGNYKQMARTKTISFKQIK